MHLNMNKTHGTEIAPRICWEHWNITMNFYALLFIKIVFDAEYAISFLLRGLCSFLLLCFCNPKLPKYQHQQNLHPLHLFILGSCNGRRQLFKGQRESWESTSLHHRGHNCSPVTTNKGLLSVMLTDEEHVQSSELGPDAEMHRGSVTHTHQPGTSAPHRC